MSDLQKQVDSLKRRIEERAYAADKKKASHWQTKATEDIGAASRFFAQIAIATMWLYEHAVLPIIGTLAVPGRFLFGWYRRLWNRIVHVRDRFGEPQFSKTRAGLFLAVTIAFVWFALLPLIELAFDTALYFATAKRDEIVYLTNSQEISPDENVHSVQGCHSLPCTDENSVYYRIRATLFNEIWSLASGHGIFFPDYVAAAVPVTISECKITSYGLRMKLMMRGMDIYPDILRTECQPIGENATP